MAWSKITYVFMKKIRKDLTNKIFGELTVIKRVDDINNEVAWLCKCNCGNMIIAKTQALTSSHKKSCGCLKSKMLCQRNKNGIKRNKYIINQDNKTVTGFTFDNKPFLFDLNDYDIIKNYTWHNSKGYLITHVIKNDKRTTIRMHRLILNIDNQHLSNQMVDHINHNTFDNRKCNLRIVDNSRNQMNRVISKNNTSGCNGVKYHKASKKWEADITINNQRINLGLYDNKTDAIKARQLAEEKYYGNYSYQNSIKKGE